jgi:uncharacterized protein (TIGR00251 family)
MSLPDFIEPHREGAALSVRVQPRASRRRIVGPHGDALKVAITAPPVDGAANKDLIDFLASVSGLPRGRVRLLSGATGRSKVVLFEDLTPEALAERIGGQS